MNPRLLPHTLLLTAFGAMQFWSHPAAAQVRHDEITPFWRFP